MALLTEPTSSTGKPNKKNSRPVPSSPASSPDSSQLLAAIDSLKARIEAIENKEHLSAEDREALEDAKDSLKTKKAALKAAENTPAPANAPPKKPWRAWDPSTWD